jgi:hypothetical protein
VADPGFHQVAEAAALETVDEPVEAALSVPGFVVEPGIGTRARIASVARPVEHAREIAEVALASAPALPVIPATILPEAAVVGFTGLAPGRRRVVVRPVATAEEVAETTGALG